MGENEEGTNNKISQVNDNHCENSGGDLVYHAVFIPKDAKDDAEAVIHVYTDKVKALGVIKNHRNGRLKSFKSKSEAEKYAQHGFEENSSANKNPKSQAVSVEEKGSSFKAPKPQELVHFRKLIEAGELDTVHRMVWENPRYLISSGDTPAILHEGCRYNGLHIASFKSSRDVEMCAEILETVSNPKFVELLYGKGDKETYAATAKIWLDLYLNTPDKGLNETPLHFAAKFGKKEVVKHLLSYPGCLKTVTNKFDQTPLQVVCTRKGDEDLAKEIRLLLEDQFYVPVWRAEDNSLQPQIGMPFSPASPPTIKIDPLSPKVEVKALAGPMTKSQAVEFRRKWKTPPRTLRTPNKNDQLNDSMTFLSPRNKNPGLRLQDTEKGLESVGRDLAQEWHVPWKEWWPFLNDYTNLRSTEGLSLLERYLINRSTQVTKIKPVEEKSMWKRNPGKVRRRCLPTEHGDGPDNQSISNSLDIMDQLINQMKMCSLGKSISSDSDSDEDFLTPPETPPPEQEDSDDENEYSLAEEDDVVYEKIFIDGDLPGKIDAAVMNAIPETIDAEIYPYIYRWKHEVLLAMKRNQFVCSTPRRRLLLTPEK